MDRDVLRPNDLGLSEKIPTVAVNSAESRVSLFM